MNNSFRILATGKQLPAKVLCNADFEQMVDTSDEWITTRTGIHKRHIVEAESTSSLAVAAARDALAETNIDVNEIALIIVATFSSEQAIPSCASIVQKELGLNDNVLMAFDLNAACTGFVYGLSVANALLPSLPGKYALVIGAESISPRLDYTDRNTCILFGDGAGAAVIESAPGLYAQYLNAAGDRTVLTCPGITAKDQGAYIYMDGKEVFKFAIKAMAQGIDQVLGQAGLTYDDIDHYVCHQANERIIRNVSKSLHIPLEKLYMNLSQYGNTSAASIPLVLDDMNKAGLLKRGDKVICVGFGGGLTWGAILFAW